MIFCRASLHAWFRDRAVSVFLRLLYVIGTIFVVTIVGSTVLGLNVEHFETWLSAQSSRRANLITELSKSHGGLFKYVVISGPSPEVEMQTLQANKLDYVHGDWVSRNVNR